MSVEAISWALNDAPVDNPTAKLVLIALANHARPDGSSSFPSVARLCRYTCLSERSVRAHLANLESDGIIERCDQRIVAAYIDRADRRPVGYNLCINLVRGVQDVQVDEERGATNATNGVQDVPERGAGDAPKPLLNRTKEPLGAANTKALAKTLAEEFYDDVMVVAGGKGRRGKVTLRDIQIFEGLIASGMSTKQIRAVFKAAHRDVFWHKVILNPPQFEKHFPRLLAECDLHDIPKAWEEVRQAIVTHGYMNRPTFVEPAIEAAIDMIGWKNLCLNTSSNAKREFEQAMKRVPA